MLILWGVSFLTGAPRARGLALPAPIPHPADETPSFPVRGVQTTGHPSIWSVPRALGAPEDPQNGLRHFPEGNGGPSPPDGQHPEERGASKVPPAPQAANPHGADHVAGLRSQSLRGDGQRLSVLLPPA